MKQVREIGNRLQAAVTPERLLRLGLGIVYLWFGLLKLVGMSPVLELVRRTYPPLATLPLYIGLALFELALGGLLLAGLWKRAVAGAVVLHLVGTFGGLISAPRMMFLPAFPFLTLEGEFVIKNLVLLAAAGALLFEAGRPPAAPRGFPRPLFVTLGLALAVTLGFGVARLHQSLRTAAQHSAQAGLREAPTTAAAVGSLTGHSGTFLVLDGILVDRCRLLGCWFKVKDATGELFVDLAPNGLSARGIRLGTRLQVTGRIGKTREGQVGFVASSIKPLGKGELQ